MKQRAQRKGRGSPTQGTAAYLCCRTCRTKRIKCDGARPSCRNCIIHNRVCLGYSSWSVPLDNAALSEVPATSTQPNTETALQLSPTFAAPSISICNLHSIDDAVRQGFDFFRYRNRPTYAARGYPTLWTTTSIDLGMHGESAVFYAMAALGTAERALIPTIHITLARPVEDSLRDEAFSMYSKAVKYLKDPLRKALRDGPLEAVILTCAIFLVFEVTSGRMFSALGHGRAGKNILEERLKNKRRLDAMLSSSFDSMQIDQPTATASHAHTSEPPASNFDALEVASNYEPSFASLDEARLNLEALGRTAQELREELLQDAKDRLRTLPPQTSVASRFCYHHTISRLMAIGRGLQDRLIDCINGLASWKRRFSMIYRARDPANRDFLFLQARFFYASFTLAMCRATTEQLADTFVDQFIRTLDSVELIVNKRSPANQAASDESASGPIADNFMQTLDLINGKSSPEPAERLDNDAEAWRPTLPSDADNVRVTGVFEIGVLHALFAIACKCRTSSLRQRAIRLLVEANRSEFFISSRALARYAEAISRLEEQQAAQLLNTRFDQQQFSADEVPENARFLDVVASDFPDDPGGFALSCTRRTDVSGTKIELLEYECPSSGQVCRLTSSVFLDAS